jgi:hypothetical protein
MAGMITGKNERNSVLSTCSNSEWITGQPEKMPKGGIISHLTTIRARLFAFPGFRAGSSRGLGITDLELFRADHGRA